MVTPSGAVFLVGGIIRLLLPPLCPHGWSPNRWFILGTCLASFYTLSSWKSRQWWIVGRGGCFASVIMLSGGCFATVLFGGCFATCGYFEFGGCFAAITLLWRMLCRRGHDIRWMLRHRFLLRACSLGIYGDSILCRSCSGGLCFGGLFGESSPFVLLC